MCDNKLTRAVTWVQYLYGRVCGYHYKKGRGDESSNKFSVMDYHYYICNILEVHVVIIIFVLILGL